MRNLEGFQTLQKTFPDFLKLSKVYPPTNFPFTSKTDQFKNRFLWFVCFGLYLFSVLKMFFLQKISIIKNNVYEKISKQFLIFLIPKVFFLKLTQIIHIKIQFFITINWKYYKFIYMTFFFSLVRCSLSIYLGECKSIRAIRCLKPMYCNNIDKMLFSCCN